jgi:hypothetical protein
MAKPMGFEQTYTPRRPTRWAIIAGILLLTGGITTAVVLRGGSSSPSSAPVYVLKASDSHFTATFPVKPQRTVRIMGTGHEIIYTGTLPDYSVAVTYLSVPASFPVSFNGGVNGAAARLPAGKVVSRNMLTYRGQPAEHGVISSSVGFSQVQIVRFGSLVYVLAGFGPTQASFAHAYTVLLDTFTPHP